MQNAEWCIFLVLHSRVFPLFILHSHLHLRAVQVSFIILNSYETSLA
jgi:hypothetical protein